MSDRVSFPKGIRHGTAFTVEKAVLDKFPYYNNYDIVEGIDHTLFISGSAGIYVVDQEDLLSGKELELSLIHISKIRMLIRPVIICIIIRKITR